MEVAEYMRGVDSWELSEDEVAVEEESNKRSLEKEKRLWRLLD